MHACNTNRQIKEHANSFYDGLSDDIKSWNITCHLFQYSDEIDIYPIFHGYYTDYTTTIPAIRKIRVTRGINIILTHQTCYARR